MLLGADSQLFLNGLELVAQIVLSLLLVNLAFYFPLYVVLDF